MNRRTFEGPMDWEYQNNRGPMDISSPFAQIPQRPFLGSSFGNDSPSTSSRPVNPFAHATAERLAHTQQPPSPSKQPFPRPPSSSLFNPATGTRSFPSASPFRNASFTTPQKRTEEILSECSGAEESPAIASDMSTLAEDTPERELLEAARTTLTPSSAVSRKLFGDSSRMPGRGEVPRGKLDHVFGRRDRVRKRKRQTGDKDVGSVRSRSRSHSHHLHNHYNLYQQPGDEFSSDESDDTDVSGRGSKRMVGSSKGTRRRDAEGASEARRGAVASLFSVIHDHPNVPLILSWWMQLGMNVFFMTVVMWFVWGGISMMRADISHAADAARGRLLAQMNECAHEYTKNRCAPKNERLPALNVMCNEWEECMNQDPSSVMKMQVSAKNVAEIINEFVGVMSFKAWGFILSAMLAVILASNMGFSRFREAAFVNATTQAAMGPQQHGYRPSQSSGAPPAPSLPPSQDPNQAYIWAPIGQTPRHIRREFLLQPDTPTDTDGSPEVPRVAIMAPPQTPSLRRSPSRAERSPGKESRSPSKGF